MDLSFELLHKYNVQGPRYTSYPPAPSWKSGYGAKEYEDILQNSNQRQPARPLSLYVHLPFCEKLCYFCGCTTFITGKNKSFEPPYLSTLKQEIDWVADRIDKKRKVIQFHFGGGTPTFSSPETLQDLIRHIKSKFSFASDAEVGIEVDPRVTTEKHLSVLREEGFNRLSMGVQDFEPDVQKAINRLQPYEATAGIVQAARELGYDSINMDLIYGLPKQTPDSFKSTIDRILGIGPDRLAVYSYAHVPWLKSHQKIVEKDLPGERQKFEIFITALKKFTESGFEYIGMDHFAKPNDELSQARKNRTLWRNFQGYTTKAGTDLIGLGMSAIGSVDDCFIQNERKIKDYEAAIDQKGAATFRGFALSKDDLMRARVIQNLLCHAVVKKSEIEEEFEISFDATFADALEKLSEPERDGLVELSKEEIRPTTIGRVFLRNLAMPFDAYLPKPGDKKVFSRTV